MAWSNVWTLSGEDGGDLQGDLVSAAAEAGLAFFQHLVVLFPVGHEDDRLRFGGGRDSAVAHTNVLVFCRRGE
jgi:hypothetical protein